MEPLASSLDDAARLLAVSRRTVEALIADGTLPSFRHGTRRLIDADGLRAYHTRRVAAGREPTAHATHAPRPLRRRGAPACAPADALERAHLAAIRGRSS